MSLFNSWLVHASGMERLSSCAFIPAVNAIVDACTELVTALKPRSIL
jgi:hypothetical protein